VCVLAKTGAPDVKKMKERAAKYQIECLPLDPQVFSG
jgi:hypothetical protein